MSIFFISTRYWRLLLVAIVPWLVSIGSANTQEINWEHDLTIACRIAEQSDKLVLVHFTADWSRRCQNINGFIFTNPSVIRGLNDHVIPVLIDVDQNPQLADELGVQEVPTDIVLTPGKKLVIKRNSPGETKSYLSIFSHIQNTNKLISQHGLKSVDSSIAQTQDRARQFVQATTASDSLRPSTPNDMLERPAPLARPQDRITRPPTPHVQPLDPLANAPLSDGRLKVSNRFFDPQQVARSTDAGDLFIHSQNQNFSTPDLARETSNQRAGMNVETGSIDSVKSPKQAQSIRIFNENFTATRSSESDLGRLTVATMRPNLKLASEYAMVNQHLSGSENATNPVLNPPPLQEEIQPMLQGNCPVTLLKEQKWVAGDRRWGSFHRNRLYLFVNQAAMIQFLQDPEFYSPLLSGYDPVLFAKTGELVVGKESLGVFIGTVPRQRVALFYDLESRLEFEANPGKFLEAIGRLVQQ